MTTLPILYTFRRCPYAMRARMALIQSHTRCEVREIKLSAKPAPMLAASPKGTVPVLILPTGEVIEESLDIMGYALSRSDPDGWAEYSAPGEALIHRNDAVFKHHLDRYKYPERYESDAGQHRGAGYEILSDLDRRLGAGPFLTGERPRLVDVAIFPFVRQFVAVDPPTFDQEPLPHLKTWLEFWLRSAVFEASMIRFPVWHEGQETCWLPAL
jgi:glutathione S-transferase